MLKHNNVITNTHVDKIDNNTAMNVILKQVLESPTPSIDLKKVLFAIYKFRSPSADSIRQPVMLFGLQKIDKAWGVNMLALLVPITKANELVKGIIEAALISVSSEPLDAIEFTINQYRSRVIEIYNNLDPENKRIDNKTLRIAIINGDVEAYDVPFMTPQQMHPVRWAKELERIRVIEEMRNTKKVTDIYKCRKCGQRKSTTIQVQTRSADEPATIFVTCTVCYHTFTTQ
jgi:DNA-directed RNA polymerase subunit M/transcription elongation factor TFIIS